MTSYKLKNKFLGTKAVEIADSKSDSLLQTRENANNSSGSSMISTSSDSSSSSNSSSTSDTLNVCIIFPNGTETMKKIDSKKAIYDLLIELSSSAKLIPTNYMLKLYNSNDNINNSIYNEEKLIDYTPNQTIGQLNPRKIHILPKTSTLRHHQVSFESNPKTNGTVLTYQSTSKSHTLYNNVSNKLLHKPFELTTCVQVNLPFNQKTTVRARPEIKLNDLFEMICREANLERKKYDLAVLNEISLPMESIFASYNTKEVSLILKSQQNGVEPSSKLLNSKNPHYIFIQNSSKTKAKNIHQNNLHSNNNKNQLNRSTDQTSEQLLRSRSEINLNLTEKSSIKNSSSSNMLGLFSRKTKTKEVIKPIPNQNSTVKPVLEIITPSSLTSKKKPAPPPPTQQAQSLKESVNNDLSSEISKILNSNKKKAPAPPPPFISTFHEANSDTELLENTENQLKVDTSLTQQSPKSIHSSDYSSAYSFSAPNNHKITSSASTSPRLPESESNYPSNYSVPSSPESSSSCEKKQLNSSEKINSLIMPVVKTHIHYSSTVIQNKYQNNMRQTYSSSLPSPLLEKQTESSIDFKKINNTKSLVRKLSLHSTSSEVDDSLENSVISGSSSKLEKFHDDHILQDNKFVDDSIIQDSENSNNINKVNQESFTSIHSSSKSIYAKNDKSVDESLLASNLRGKFFGIVSDQKTLSEDDFSDLESIKAINSPSLNTSIRNIEMPIVSRYQQYLSKCDDFSQNKADFKLDLKPALQDTNLIMKSDVNNNLNETIKYNDHKVKKIASNDFIPEFSTSLLSFVTNVESNDYVNFKETKTLKHTPSARQSPPLAKSEDTKPHFLRSPTSPLPQFPAINANELSQQHQNYTVVRSGEIIAKNGAYYSTDGTIRGYSGTVKKIANSKTLNEIFTRQLELEQQHERDYQLELDMKKKQDDENQKKMNSLDRKQSSNGSIAKRQSLPQQVVLNTYTKGGRTSLGNIIMNEKNAINKSNTLTVYSSYMRQKSENLKENELSKKLEERANKISAGIANKPLQIDTNVRPLEPAINSNSSESSSESSNSYNNNKASYNTTQASSLSPTSSRVGYTKIYDLKNENSKESLNSTSSSSSMSTFSYELIMNKPFQAQPKAYSSVKSTTGNSLTNRKPTIDFHTMLLNEIKAVVPLIAETSKENTPLSLIKVPGEPPASEPPLYLPQPSPNAPPLAASKQTTLPPNVAPKTFSVNARKTLNQKNQVISNRDNLLDSIKSFSVSSLRKTDNYAAK